MDKAKRRFIIFDVQTKLNTDILKITCEQAFETKNPMKKVIKCFFSKIKN